MALAVPAEVRESLDAAVAPVRRGHEELRWTRPEGWHLTLAFLGSVDESRLTDVRSAVVAGVAEVDPPSVGLRLAASGHFGRRVLWAGVDDHPPGVVARLGAAIRQAMGDVGLPCDDQPVHPHVTLARAPRRGRLPRDVVGAVPTVAGEWTVRSVEVMSSVTDPDGARYEEVAAVRW